MFCICHVPHKKKSKTIPCLFLYFSKGHICKKGGIWKQSVWWRYRYIILLFFQSILPVPCGLVMLSSSGLFHFTDLHKAAFDFVICFISFAALQVVSLNHRRNCLKCIWIDLTGIIVTAAVLGLAIVVLLAIVLYCLMKGRKKSAQHQRVPVNTAPVTLEDRERLVYNSTTKPIWPLSPPLWPPSWWWMTMVAGAVLYHWTNSDWWERKQCLLTKFKCWRGSVLIFVHI